MSYDIIAIPNFSRKLKKLAKKYPSIKTDLTVLAESLQTNPIQGADLGNNCYKIRMAITSKGKGKSGGARIITYLQVSITAIYLLTVYDKSDKENISDSELKELLKQIPNE
jgi:hypothetical protein